jgi:hypothetical protein
MPKRAQKSKKVKIIKKDKNKKSSKKHIYECQKNHRLKNYLQALRSPIMKYLKKQDKNFMIL